MVGRPFFFGVVYLLAVANVAQGQRLLRLATESVEPSVVSAASVRPESDPAAPIYVEVDLTLLRSGPPRLALPTPDGRLLVAERSAFEDRGDGDVMWSGGLPAAGYDSVVLTIKDGSFVGRFGEPGGARFRIGAVAGSGGRMRDTSWGEGFRGESPEVPSDALYPGGAGRTLPAGALRRDVPDFHLAVPASADNADGDADRVDILVLYTESAAGFWRADAMEPQAAIQNAVDYLNMVFRNGDLKVSARLVHVAEAAPPLGRVNENPSWYGHGGVVQRMEWDGEILRLRTEHRADLVHLFTGESGFTVSGAANQLTKSQSAESLARHGYGFTSNHPGGRIPFRHWNDQDDAEIFAHEIGHNLGAHHDPGHVDPVYLGTAVAPYAFGHFDESRLPYLGSAMSYVGQTVPYFSTIRIRPWGRDLGIAGKRENERALRESVRIVSRLSDRMPYPGPGAPEQPTDVRVRAVSDTSIRVTWTDNSLNETSFRVHTLPHEPGHLGEHAVPANSTSVTIEDLPPGVAQEVWVVAIGEEGSQSLRSSIVPVVLPGREPPVATGLAVTFVSGRQVRLSWKHEDLSRVEFFEYELRQGVEEERVGFRVFCGKSLERLAEVNPGVRYTFRVRTHYRRSVTDSGFFEFELPEGGLAEPSNLEASWVDANTIRLSWTDNATGEYGIAVNGWIVGQGGWSFSELLDPDNESIQVGGLIPGARYRFEVMSILPGGPFSPVAAINVAQGSLGNGPSAPGNLRLEGGSRLRWQDNSGDEVGFEILRSDSLSRLPPVHPVQWRRAGLVGAGVEFFEPPEYTLRQSPYWRVVAYNASGASVGSNILGEEDPAGPGTGPSPDPDAEYTDCVPSFAQVTFDHGYRVSACFEYQREGITVAEDASDYRLDAKESGLLYFFERDNAEVLIKVLDACGVNGHRWVFVAPVTDLALNLDVLEVASGRRWSYRNPRGGRTAATRSDTAAFPCDATATSWAGGGGPQLAGSDLVRLGAGPLDRAGRNASDRTGLSGLPSAAASGVATDCAPGGPVLTLRGGYTVSMCYETADDLVGDARDWGLDSSQSGLLYFFERDNVEVLIKVLDGCGVNGHRWVFVAPVTDLAFNLIVESPDGQRWTHTNRLGRTADAASDVSAFPCASSA